MTFTERKIIFHGNHFTRFYLEQTPSVQEKIEYVLRIIRQVERVPKTFLQHMEGLYEVRVEYSSNIFRIFCCFDEGNLVVLFNGFQKKSQKTPVNELQLAKRLMKEYFDLKKKQDEKQKRSNKKR